MLEQDICGYARSAGRKHFIRIIKGRNGGNMKNKLERNPVGMIGYMIQNLCGIYNGGIYHREENEELLEQTIDMLNAINDKLDCFWEDKDKIPEIINIIAKYNAMDGSEMMKRSMDAWLKR
jgi:hypothetical protein